MEVGLWISTQVSVLCGRLNVLSDPLAQFLLEAMGVEYQGLDQVNLSPTADVSVLIQPVAGSVEAIPMRWWLVPAWSDGPSTKYAMFNARVESASRSPAFRGPYRTQRCLVPVSGYYEWSEHAGKKLPTLVRPRDAGGMFLGGLWDRWTKGDQEMLSFTILTTQASENLSRIHARQPVILSSSEALRWLDMSISTKALESVLRPRLSVALELVPVATYVNKSTNQLRECMEPIGKIATLEIDVPGGLLH